MTEKRFIRKGYKIWDTWKDKEVYEMTYFYQVDIMCDIMNELVDENEQLKNENNILKASNGEYEDALGRLEEENEKLKKENNKWIVDYNGLNAEYQWLKEENEQLKQRINSRLHFYRELYESTNDKVVERVIEDLKDILKR